MWLWALLPISLAVFGTVGIWTVFAVAVTNGSVNLTEGIPFISNCGTYNPQSCLFSQICNICSVLSLWIVVIRYQQVQDYGDHGKANIASIVLGFISSIGISVIGNFQQSVLMGIHLFGAFLAFFIGLAYFWVQLFLTYRAEPSQDRCWVGPVRALCCTFCTILVFANTGICKEASEVPLIRKTAMKTHTGAAYSLICVVLIDRFPLLQCPFSTIQSIPLELLCVNGLWSCCSSSCSAFLQPSSDTLTATSSLCRDKP
ncbi:modulator of macroautophagy TMEM150B isoform X1 [Channa argus]|uniref:modulator of macroautophagy TMEM150B isoform X1 n=1 Tax=Channa argus TaxID=215402 RepID=UPI00352022D9